MYSEESAYRSPDDQAIKGHPPTKPTGCCVPNGGAACSAMTELQPSPAGYRGQDEVPGPPTHPVAFGKSYPSHGHIETCNYSIPGYLGSQAHAGSKQQPLTGSRGSSPGDDYRRKSDRWSSENDSNVGDNAITTKTAITGYNEAYGKKNTPGYKNDSGYSESIGFDSYSLPFNEADEASPPPTPPVRDASSLKGVCCGPGHEKYPSWPSTASEHHHHHQHYPDNDIDSSSIDLECSQSGSHRSKSWTDDTNYSKDKPAQYSRPLAKRPNPTFTQQLKTVMERCEKIPTENYESRGSRTSLEDDQTRLWPCVDRESNSLGATDPEYVVAASPSERDQHQHQHQHQQQPQHQKQSPQTLSHADLEAYVRNYHDPQVSQVDIYRETALTQAGLEEYTRVQHSQQASYAQSEGYHSYVSSVDSTTNTPFLDRLRRDSEAVAQRAAPSWEETSREGRDSVVTTSSGGSASSSETLKWHGSMSDVSVSSGLPTRQVNGGDVWPHGSMSDVSSINGSGIQKHTIPHDSDHDKWQGSMSDVSSSLMISSSKLRLNNINNSNNSNNNSNNNSINSNGSISIKNNDNKWQENKWQATMNDRNCKQISSRTSLPSVISHYASVNDVCQASSGRDAGKWQESSIDEETLDKSKGIQRGWESCINVDQARYNHNSRPIPQSSMSQSQTQAQTQSQSQSQTQQGSDDWNPLHGSMSDVSQANISIHPSSKQLIAHSARVQTPQRHHSESVLYLDRERTLRKLYPVSTGQRDEPGQTRISPVSPQQPHLSVAERINELEKQQQQMRYTYLDPEKRHRVSDPTLKAIQKKALLSYYERHHQSSWRSEPQLAQGAVPPQSPPPQPPPRPRPPSSRRASSASDYASISWREKTSPSQGQRSCDMPSPKHQHSNSCGSLSTDLLGPVIVGPAISIDDWVPERPPKKPHLRAVYNDTNNRVPSPDLPPPSPPTVTESEVLNCDEPLPPPPPPLNEPSLEAAKDQEEKRQSSSSSNSSSRRSSKQSKKVEANSASNGSKSQFIRSTPLNLEFTTENVNPGFATHRVITGRSSLRYPSAQKLSVTRRTSEELTNNSRPPARLPDLSTRYSHPVESRIIRQESMRVESTRIDASGLIKMEDRDRDRVLESSTGQRPQPQVPKTGSEKNSSGYARPNYLALSDCNIKNGKYSEAMGYSVAPGVKTSYEANAKLLEGSPQKYHDPPKYVGSNQRNYYVLPSKFSECEKFLTSPSSPPPPLAPRQSCGRKSLAAPPRPAPPCGQG
ncbi:hypothetical protein KQX54_019858 [Cotesia glomerata]|uniref:Protein Shroom n=1 Tax=Cotesia glomerata TaxID=32391 RepID=A0AAV7HVS6_COTGL|nr:hypothetical protein KQX54_019858 [Cotesia glomerata]